MSATHLAFLLAPPQFGIGALCRLVLSGILACDDCGVVSEDIARKGVWRLIPVEHRLGNAKKSFTFYTDRPQTIASHEFDIVFMLEQLILEVCRDPSPTLKAALGSEERLLSVPDEYSPIVPTENSPG
ncbi:MAG: hypothetical protein HQL41_18555 [Alphaproteobacteria bacterium]|nr:hypothetical protein [Alphaproteobacteria bacterium]